MPEILASPLDGIGCTMTFLIAGLAFPE